MKAHNELAGLSAKDGSITLSAEFVRRARFVMWDVTELAGDACDDARTGESYVLVLQSRVGQIALIASPVSFRARRDLRDSLATSKSNGNSTHVL